MIIKCIDRRCRENTRPQNTVDLIKNYRDCEGWLRCGCGRRGYIEKSFTTQEGPTWAPFLKGVIELGDAGDTYQPFVFLVGDKPDEHADQVWFSYYKDMRPWGGRLKIGHGPGGPPVLAAHTVGDLLQALVKLGCIDREESTQSSDSLPGP
jgi:hypothetical protein